MAGNLRNSISSRLGTLVGTEMSLFWLIIIFGLILLSNAGIPPIPSFPPEVFIIITAIVNRGYSIRIFLLLRLFVCYYNAYLFLWISHIKPAISIRRKVFFIESWVVIILVVLRLESLLWLQVF
jgi:hypothetical protein